MKMKVPEVYGIIAEFDSPDEIISAAKKVREAGYKRLDAFTPFPIHGLISTLDFRDSRIPWTMFICGMGGAMGGFLLQYWVSVIEYPLNIGGRPLLSWPSFIPITFECGVLCAGISGFLCVFLLNGLPRLHHPVFSAPNFERATQDKFFLLIDSRDPSFDLAETSGFLKSLNPASVSEIIDGDDD